MKKFTLILASALIATAANAITLSDLAGTYVSSFSEWYVYDWSSTSADTWESWSSEIDVTITVNDDNTVTLSTLSDTEATFTGTVDLEKNTISLTPVAYSYYVYCGAPAEYGTNGYGYGSTDTTAPIVATIDENGSIHLEYVGTFQGWVCAIYYDTLAKLDWQVAGNMNFFEYDYDAEAYGENPVVTKAATLRKYTDGGAITRGCQYELVNTDLWPDYMQFNVDHGLVDFVNATDGYFYWYYINGKADCTALYAADYGEFVGDAESGVLSMEYYDYPDYNDESNYTYGAFEFTWGTTGLNSIKTDKVDANAPAFDIMGRVVKDTTVPGIYIQGGKKFIVR